MVLFQIVDTFSSMMNTKVYFLKSILAILLSSHAKTSGFIPKMKLALKCCKLTTFKISNFLNIKIHIYM